MKKKEVEHSVVKTTKEKLPPKVKKAIEWIHFRDFLIFFLGGELFLSVVPVALMYAGIVPSDPGTSVLVSGIVLILYAFLVIFACIHIYMGECSPLLFFKTALPAYAIVGALSLLAVKLKGSFLIWCFAPLRLLRMLGYSNLRSIVVCNAAIVAIIFLSFLAAKILAWLWGESDGNHNKEK